MTYTAYALSMHATYPIIKVRDLIFPAKITIKRKRCHSSRGWHRSDIFEKVISSVLSSCFTDLFQIGLPAFADEVPDIKAEAFILMDMETGEVLCEKSADQKRSPASTTKILTSIIALERAGLDTEMTASQTAINSVDIYNYVTAG